MGKRILFATTNWTDAPNKPSCFSQVEWDAMRSSKFNGLPFANHVVTTYSDYSAFGDLFQTFKAEIQAIQPDDIYIPNKGRLISDQVEALAGGLINAAQSQISDLSCENIPWQIWDGSTYYTKEDTFEHSWNWPNHTEDGTTHDGTYEASYEIRIPSNSSTEITPVVGFGTDFPEMSKEAAMALIWRVKIPRIAADGGVNYTLDIVVGSEVSYKQAGTATCTAQLAKSFQNNTLMHANENATSQNQEEHILNNQWPESNGDFVTETPMDVSCGCICDGASGSDVCSDILTDGNVSISTGDTTTCDLISPYEENTEQYWYAISAGMGVHTSADIDMRINTSNRSSLIVTVKSGDLVRYFLNVKGLLGVNFSSYRLGASLVLLKIPKSIQGPKQGAGEFIKSDGGIQYLSLDLFGVETVEIPFRKIDYTGMMGTTSFSHNTTLTGILKIEGLEWYEYGNSQGDPVYNSSTGEELVDLLS